MVTTTLVIAALATVPGRPAIAEDQPAELSPAGIQVYPLDVQLTTIRDRQSLIVQSYFENGITQDVTADATFVLSDPNLATIENNVLAPTADGQCELTVTCGGHSVSLSVEVKKAAADKPISFKLDVMPVFMKAGCNTGSCHGAARGKDGFRLSLFGFDPDGDYFRLTREISGRRINLALPEECLMLEKATGKVPHTGGKRFDENSEYADTLVRWLDAGAPRDEGEVPKVVAVEIYPPGAVLDGEGSTQQINVRAKYSDGTDRDVTSFAYFLSNNDNSAPISQEGVVTATNRGEAFIMARFETHTVGTHFIVLPQGLEFSWCGAEEYNYVDQHMHEKFRKLRINPSDVCSDEQFLRRATLDIAGVLPTLEEYDRFLADTDPKKRDKLVDELTSRKEFVEIWVMKWAELLQIRTTKSIAYKPMLRYYNWLQEKIANNVPMDKMVQELLGSNGGTFENAATNYYQMESDPLKVAENVAQVFMGMRIQCTQCHNHPFDRWTMDDYYSFANFFSQIGRKGSEDNREQIIYNRGSGAVRHPVGNRVMPPKFLGGIVPDVASKDRREVLAKWLASDENPFFAKNMANIVWGHFMGVGIVEPVDDVRISNPPSNPELLDELGQRFAKSGYNFKQLVRDICNSRTYQRTVQSNDSNRDDTRNFAKASIRRVRAEVLLDIISQVTDTQNKFRGLPSGASAVEIVDGRTSTFFLTTFGRASRDTVCSCEVALEPNLSQALHLLNGSTVNNKCTQGGIVAKALAAKKTPSDIIDDLYLRCLARKPTATEKEKLMPFFGDKGYSETDVLNDLFWAILNSKEFIFNH